MKIKTQQKFNSGILFLILNPFSFCRGYYQSLYLVTKFLLNALFNFDASIMIFKKHKKFNLNFKYPFMMDIFYFQKKD